MKKLFVLLVLVGLLVPFVYSGCGSSEDDEGDAGTSEKQCEEICEKNTQCEYSSPKQECLTRCNNARTTYRASAFNDFYNCLMDSNDFCNDKYEKCINTTANKCGNEADANQTLHNYCAKHAECENNPNITEENCVSDMTQYDTGTKMLRCLKDSALSEINSCIDSATCDSVSNCLTDPLFIEF